MSVALAEPPRTVAAASIERRLRTVRWRWWQHVFVGSYGGYLPCGAAAALGWGVVRFFQERPVVDAWTIGVAVGCGPIIMALFTTFGLNGGALSLGNTARLIDFRGRTHDRFQTALALAGRPATTLTPLETLALDECSAYIGRFDFRPAIPVRVPRAIWWTPVPLIALVSLAVFAALGIGQLAHDPALQAAVDKRADALAQIAEKLRRDPTHSPDADKLAEELKKSADRLRDGERKGDENRQKDALKELSSLEAMLNAMKQVQQDGKVSPAELSALAAALAANDKTQAAAESMRAGQLEQAAAQLEQILEQLKKDGDASKTLDQLAQSMQEQAAKLTEAERNELARQMEQAAQGAQSSQPQLSEQALQRLAELLRRAGANGAGQKSGRQQASNGKGGQPMTERQLQDLINALENMKDGLRPGDGEPSGPPQNGPGSEQGLASVDIFGKDPSGDPEAGDKPAGLPGSEHDVGHPDKLFGEQPVDAAKSGQAHRIEGLLGDGETMQQLTAAGGGDPAKASRRYKELYQAVTAAAQDTVEQENIPLGSRFYIKRYFENIRPKE